MTVWLINHGIEYYKLRKLTFFCKHDLGSDSTRCSKGGCKTEKQYDEYSLAFCEHDIYAEHEHNLICLNVVNGDWRVVLGRVRTLGHYRWNDRTNPMPIYPCWTWRWLCLVYIVPAVLKDSRTSVMKPMGMFRNTSDFYKLKVPTAVDSQCSQVLNQVYSHTCWDTPSVVMTSPIQ